MLDISNLSHIQKEIKEQILANKELFEKLMRDIATLKAKERRIQPRSTTALAMVATDGGNNELRFDPFNVHMVRIVDSSQNELFFKILTPRTNLDSVNKTHIDRHGRANDIVGELMLELGIKRLQDLSHMLKTSNGIPTNRGWVYDYRQIVEWAVLFKLFKKEYGSDTLIMFDGLLRTKVFWPGIFPKIQKKILEAIDLAKKRKKELYLCGIAKKSKLLSRYRLAMLAQEVLHAPYPLFCEVPPSLERQTYEWDEFVSPTDEEINSRNFKDFAAGRLFFVKFGSKRYDPIWAVDIFAPQKDQAAKIFGYMQADAIQGFPVPYYPLALQKAHNYAAMVDFDYDILQSQITQAMREMLEDRGDILDIFSMLDIDPAQKRY